MKRRQEETGGSRPLGEILEGDKIKVGARGAGKKEEGEGLETTIRERLKDRDKILSRGDPSKGKRRGDHTKL